MRVLHLYNVFGAATERSWLAYPQRLADRGWAPTFACERIATEAPNVKPAPVILKRIVVEPTEHVDEQMNAIAASPPDDPALAELLQADFDLVHGHFGPRLLHAAPFLQRGIPAVISLYGYDLSRLLRDPAWAERYRWASEHGATFVVLCEAMRNTMLELGVDEQRVRVVHLGIDPDQWAYQPRPAPAPPRFVFVGRLTAKKGLPTLIDAFDQVLSQHPAATLEIIGDGELAPELRTLVNYRGLDEAVLLLGNWEREKIARRLAGATAFVLPSVEAADGDREGTPVVLMEAQALGVPCITTEHSGNPEVLPPESRHVCVVPERDVAGLAEAMAVMIDMPAATRRTLQDAGRAWIESQFCLDATVAGYDQLYHELTASA